MRIALPLFVFVVAFGSSPIVHADATSASAKSTTTKDTGTSNSGEQVKAQAKAEFRKGVDFARSGSWVPAREHFERAYKLVPHPSVLVNLASAQRKTGLWVEAIASYRKFLADTEGDEVQGPQREAAKRAIYELEENTPKVSLQIEGLKAGHEVSIDHQRYAQESLSQPIRVNPGWHAVQVSDGDRGLAAKSFGVKRGESKTVALNALDLRAKPEKPAPVRISTSPQTEKKDKSVWKNPWLWTGVGAAVATGVVLAILLANGGNSASPEIGNFPPGTAEVE